MSLVLIVDDKESMRDSVSSTLRRAGHEVLIADGPERGLELFRERRPHVVLTDLRMPGATGIDLLERIRAIDEEVPVVLMTAFGSIETAVRAIKLGAFDYITKPFEGDELLITIKRASRHAEVLRENALLRVERAPRACEASGMDRLIGDSPALRRVKEQVRAVAEASSNVLICGASGSGKEVVARAIHDLSPRRDKPFLAVNCAALSESLLESELFGHEKGSFTGADRTRKGRFELADGGTLLLDEISEVPMQTQAKLLRVLQERAFERVGSSVTIGVDVRVIATSNRDLPRAVGSGEFRQDLFFRLNVLPIHLPPLRDRPEDVAQLARHFIAQICEREGRALARIRDEALELLSGYSWPGNVRELQNICDRAVVLSAARGGSGEITRELVEPWLFEARAAQAIAGGAGERAGDAGHHASSAGGLGGGHALNGTHAGAGNGSGFEPGRTVTIAPGVNGGGRGAMVEDEIRPLADIEREVIVTTLKQFNGHRQRTARALGIGVRTLGLKLKKWKEEHLVEASL
ncbi:MAG: sigma-54-dependent transcriptional regulator [Phycisphaerales bacterium JB037]